MAVMGEEAADVWTDEFRRTGRVVFPVRRRPVVVRFALFSVPFVSSLLSSADRWDEGGATRFFNFLGVAGFLLLVGVHGWQLMTRRPELTVDHQGIRVDRKRFMPWTEIGTIGIPHGPKFLMTLPVLPNDVWAKHLTLSQDNVRDIPALARWLEQVLKDHRRSTTT
jgi:hypothetical protein